MLKVLLIEPPWYRLFGSSLQSYPRGLCYLAAFLESKEYRVKVYNADFIEKQSYIHESRLTKHHEEYLKSLSNINLAIWQEVKNTISCESPDIVGISAKTSQFRSALNVAKLAKEVNKNICVVVGGPHATLRPEDFLIHSSVDIVVHGEGEIIFYEIICRKANSDSIGNVPGISFKNNGNIVHNKPMPLVKDLDSLPFPARHLLLNKERYLPNAFGGMIASRGCPYNCIYCCSPTIWNKKIRYRSPNNIIDEILYTKSQYGTKNFFFEDDCFTLNRALVKKLCKMLIRLKLDIKWGCLTRADLIDEDLLKIMKEAGLYLVEIGIETGSSQTLKDIRKKETLDELAFPRELCDKYDILFEALCMFGFPWESEEDMFRTVRFAKSLSPFRIEYSFVTPYPSTALYEIYKRKRLLPDQPDWSIFYHQSPDIFALSGHDPKLVNLIEEELDNYNIRNLLRFIPSLIHYKTDTNQLNVRG